MKKQSAFWKKRNIGALLLKYWRNHVVLYALYQILLNGFSAQGLEKANAAITTRIYRKIFINFKDFIKAYKHTHSGQNRAQKHNPVVWTFWMQGMENAPEVVQKCHASVRRYITDRPIVVLSEENYQEYVKFPAYIMEKYEKGIITKTHFSDLLRLELLAKYGGTWIDSTVFCSETPFQPFVLDSELFLYHEMAPGPNSYVRAISSWLITADSENPIILLTRDLLYEYWRRYDYVLDYYLIHCFLMIATNVYPEAWKDVAHFGMMPPHRLQNCLFAPYDAQTWESIRKQTSFHKLTYKFPPEKAQRTGTYYDVIVH